MRTISILAAWFAAGMILVACTPSRVEMDHGTSYNLQKYNQTLNADAHKNLKPVEGMDGKAANNAVDKYHKDFEKPIPPQTFTFSVGSGTSTGGN